MNEISSEMLQRLAGTLLHFLWQGAFLALVLLIVLRVMARRPAESRYAAAVAGMGFMLASPVFTYIFYVETGGGTLRAMQYLRSSFSDMARSGAGPEALRWATWIVAIWAVGVCACSIRLITGWLLSVRIIRAANDVVPPLAAQLFDRVRRELLGRRTIRLLVGKAMDSPLVFGWIRPVVLLPATAVTGLTENQLLAILAHELAHVRRHDFLVNTLQRAVECILFYHPAVWWISGRIRVERERCCDDLAVRVCGDRMAYAEALIALERTRSTESGLAMAAAGGSVADRVRRILGSRSPHRDWQSAVAALLFAAIFGGAGLLQPPALASTTTLAVKAGVTAPAPVQVAPDALSTPFNAIVAIATAQAARSAPQAESHAPTQPPQVTRPVIAPSREAARDKLGLLRVEYSVDSFVRQAAEGDTIAVETFLMAGMKIDARDTAGFTALTKAAQARQTETVQALLAGGANPNLIATWEDSSNKRNSASALFFGAQNGDVDTMKVLLAGGAAVDMKSGKADISGIPRESTALMEAAQFGHVNAVTLLLDNNAAVDGVDGDGAPLLAAACSGKGVSTLRVLVERGANVTAYPKKETYWAAALHCVARIHNADNVRLLLDKGADVNARDSRGSTALLGALETVHNEQPLTYHELIRRNALLLIERGADVNAKSPNSGSRTSLRLAVRAGLTDVVLALLEKGADITGADNLSNLLFEAIEGTSPIRVSSDHTATATLLIERGADVNAKRNNTDTPLIRAVVQKQTDIVRLLLAKGADPNVPAVLSSGLKATVLRMAAGHAEITELLLNAGARQ